MARVSRPRSPLTNEYRVEEIPWTSDPSNVAEFQDGLTRAFNTRWRTVRGDLRTTIDRNDALGLSESSSRITPRRSLGPFDHRGALHQYRPDDLGARETGDRLDQFDDWIEYVLEGRVLSPTSASRRHNGEHYTAEFARRSYLRGAIRATNYLRSAGIRPDAELPGASEILSDPRHVDRLSSLYSDLYHDVKVVVRAVEEDLFRTLSRRLRDGTSVRSLANALTARVDAVGQTRTKTATLVRTVEAANLAALLVYADAGVETVRTMVSFDPTAADACDRCLPVARTAYRIEDIETGTAPLIPLDTHPGSASFYIPA